MSWPARSRRIIRFRTAGPVGEEPTAHEGEIILAQQLPTLTNWLLNPLGKALETKIGLVAVTSIEIYVDRTIIVWRVIPPPGTRPQPLGRKIAPELTVGTSSNPVSLGDDIGTRYVLARADESLGLAKDCQATFIPPVPGDARSLEVQIAGESFLVALPETPSA